METEDPEDRLEGMMGGRIRGRRGQVLRRQRLGNQPLCEDCWAKGKAIPANVPDHVKPLALGGEDVDENIRCLCNECHRIRTAEQFGRRVKRQIGPDGWAVE